MKYAIALALVSTVALGSAAQAAETTAAQRAACTPDVWRLCSSDIPDVGAIKACLRRQKAQLSSGCRTVIEIADKGVQVVAAK